MAAHSAAAQPPLKMLFQKWVAIGVLASAVNMDRFESVPVPPRYREGLARLKA